MDLLLLSLSLLSPLLEPVVCDTADNCLDLWLTPFVGTTNELKPVVDDADESCGVGTALYRPNNPPDRPVAAVSGTARGWSETEPTMMDDRTTNRSIFVSLMFLFVLAIFLIVVLDLIVTVAVAVAVAVPVGDEVGILRSFVPSLLFVITL